MTLRVVAGTPHAPGAWWMPFRALTADLRCNRANVVNRRGVVREVVGLG